MQLSPEAVKNNLFSAISDMAAAPWLFSTQKTAFSRKRKISFTDTILSVLSIALINNYILPIRPGRNSPRYIKARTVTSFLYR